LHGFAQRESFGQGLLFLWTTTEGQQQIVTKHTS